MSLPAFVDIPNIRLGITHESGTLRFANEKLEFILKSGEKMLIIKSEDIKNLELMNIDSENKMIKIIYNNKEQSSTRFIGFQNEEESKLNDYCRDYLNNKKLTGKAVCVKGGNYGNFVLRPSEMVCRSQNEKEIIFSIPYETFNQSVIQGKNELSFEFNSNINNNSNNNGRKIVDQSVDELTEMRIFIPDDEESGNGDGDGNGGATYEQFNEILIKRAKLENDKSQIIAWFKKINFRVPRGKNDMQFYPKFFLFRGGTFSYKIEYQQIKKLFVFKQPDDKISFLVALSPPIRQGGSTYGYLIMEFPQDENCQININVNNEEDLKTIYNARDGQQVLSKNMEGPTYDILSRVFMALSKIKIIEAKNFESAGGKHKCVRCSLGAHQGLLYPLEKGIFFIWKPVTYIRHNDIKHMEFARIIERESTQTSTASKLFDLVIYLNKKDASKLTFTGIDKIEYEPLLRYVLSKQNINLLERDLHEQHLNNIMSSSSRQTRTRKNLQPSSFILNNNNDNNNNVDDNNEDDEDVEDGDYNMAMDADLLKEDDNDDKNFTNIVDDENADEDADFDVDADDDDEDDDIDDDDNGNNNDNNNKKNKKNKHNDDLLIDDDNLNNNKNNNNNNDDNNHDDVDDDIDA